MTDSPQQRRLQRLKSEGIHQRNVLVHEDNQMAFNAFKPAFGDAAQTSILTTLAEQLQTEKLVNISQVRQLSPFRYPGGKTWLIPVVREWIAGMERRPKLLVESFAGGAIVGLTAAAEGWVDHVRLVEKDDEIAAVWNLTINGEDRYFEQFINGIARYEFNVENVRKTIDSTPRAPHTKALRTIVKNRAQRGGIMAPGAGLMKSGEAGKGIASRWYPDTLVKRLMAIRSIRDRLTFVQGDAIAEIATHQDPGTIHFVDPPYTASGKKAGRRLYTHNDVDHNALFQVVSRCGGAAMLTYDDNRWVRDKAAEFGFDLATSTMQNTHLVKMYELVIVKASA